MKLDKDFVDAEIKRITKNLDDGIIFAKKREFKLEKNFMDYVVSDIIDSYNKLIAQRKECIDKYSKFYSLFLSDDDDIDILKNYKTMLKLQNKEITQWNHELRAIKEIKKTLDEYDDAEIEQELRSYLEERTPTVYNDD